MTDVESSQILLLTELEIYLEDMNDTLDDNEFHCALNVVGLRVNTRRMRTTAMVDMVLYLNSIKKPMIQSQDARIAIGQGESVQKLALVTMGLFAAFICSVSVRYEHETDTEGTNLRICGRNGRLFSWSP